MTKPDATAVHSRQWAAALADWAIPPDILAQAPTSPWIHPVDLFTAAGPVADSPSHARAREVLDADSSVLDIGCGGGRASFALVPPATDVTGVDHQEAMLEAYARRADELGVSHREVLGDWPEVADRTQSADVVVVHHVAYNVPDLAAFALAADAHARRRVVFELPQFHPLAWMAPLWQHFWDLSRPHGPSADDAAAVLREAGLTVQLERWPDERSGATSGGQVSFERRVEMTRIRLCLNESRDAEIAEQLRSIQMPSRDLVTLWWDRAQL